MTKNIKKAIILINMRITVKRHFGQLHAVNLTVICLFFISAAFFAVNASSCKANREEKPVVPPVTSPLTRDYIGFGVITTSFTHINEDPADDSRSLGYLRRGSLVRIIRRQVIKTHEEYVSWVLTDGKHDAEQQYQDSLPYYTQGWLKEDVMEIYSNESQAKTASESMVK